VEVRGIELPHNPTGWLREIFPSIQGEGLYCGQAQTFVRFAGCNLACAYCDTPESREPNPSEVRVSGVRESGGRKVLTQNSKLITHNSQQHAIPNPVDIETIADICERLKQRVVSLTGGEPLMQADYLAALMAEIHKRGKQNYLETNGTLYEELSLVVKYADCIAMDIKLPSATGQPAQWNAHTKFLETALGTKVFVKAIVAANTPESEIAQCAELMASLSSRVPLVIQPVCGLEPSGEQLMRFQKIASSRLDDVRVIPQCHKALGLR
jgi:7-carboxy-7-deazaguanine synthase